MKFFAWVFWPCVALSQGLVPDIQFNDIFLFNNPSQIRRFYSFRELQPNQHYQIRASFHGALPVSLKLELSCEEAASAPRRHLLDVENVVFETDENSKILGSCSDATQLAMTVSYIATDFKATSIPIHIVLETLQFGAPRGAFWILPLVAVGVFVLYRLVWPWFDRAIRRKHQTY